MTDLEIIRVNLIALRFVRLKESGQVPEGERPTKEQLLSTGLTESEIEELDRCALDLLSSNTTIRPTPFSIAFFEALNHHKP